MLRISFGWMAGAAVSALATAVPIAAQNVDYSGSVQYATGEYFLAVRSNSVFVVNGLGLSAGRLRLSASMPLVLQTSPWLIDGGGGTTGAGIGGSPEGAGSDLVVDTVSQQHMGIGDPMLYVGLELVGGPSAPMSIRLTGSAKMPVGDVERGFSTGEWDYAAGLSVSGMFGTTMLFGELAYWIFGDPLGVEYRDPIAFSFGFGRTLAQGKLGLLASLFGYTPVIEGVAPPVQASVGLSYLTSSRTSLMASAAFGLTESSPDIGFSFGWTVALAGR